MILRGYMAKKCKKMQKFRNPTVKTKNMCGTNEKIQLGNTSVRERNAFAMQNIAICTTVASSFCIVSNSKDRWVSAAIIIFTIIHHYHHLCNNMASTSLPPTQKVPKVSNRTHKKVLTTIVYINLFKVTVKLMKIRNSLTGKYFSKRKKSLLKKQDRLFFLQSPHCGQVSQNSESSSAQLSPSTSPYPTSLKSLEYSNKTHKKAWSSLCVWLRLSENNALLRSSASWSSFWYCGCFKNSSSSTPRWHFHRCLPISIPAPALSTCFRDLLFTHLDLVAHPIVHQYLVDHHD